MSLLMGEENTAGLTSATQDEHGRVPAAVECKPSTCSPSVTHSPERCLATEFVDAVGCVHHQRDVNVLRFSRLHGGVFAAGRPLKQLRRRSRWVGGLRRLNLRVFPWRGQLAGRPAHRLRVPHASIARCTWQSSGERFRRCQLGGRATSRHAVSAR